MALAEFLDSTAYRGDGKKLRSLLAKNGYLFLRGVMDRERVRAVAEQIADRLAAGGFVERCGADILSDGIIGLREDLPYGTPEFMTRYRNIYCSSMMHSLPAESPVAGILETIYGEAVVQHPMILPRIVFPPRGGSAQGTVAHQDYPGNQGSERSVTVWCPLGDYDLDAGMLVLASGRHREGIFAHGISFRNIFEISTDFSHDEVCGAIRAGDVLIFTAFTPHRALPNSSKRVRLSVDFRFQPMADPVSSLNFGDFCPTVGQPWQDVYDAGAFPDASRFYWKECDLQYQRHVDDYFDIQVEAAFSAAEKGETAAVNFLRALSVDSVSPKVKDRALAFLDTL